jgi:hypothetical protein
MMPYQVYQLYQAERTKTAAEIRRADEQLGELSRALSSAWQHATRSRAVLRALAEAVAEPGSPGQPPSTNRSARNSAPRPTGPRRADYLTGYHPSFPAGTPSAPSDRPDERAA